MSTSSSSSVSTVLQSCHLDDMKPFGEKQLFDITLQSALDSHKLLRQLLSSFNDNSNEEEIRLKEKKICLLCHQIRNTLEILIGKQNKELLVTINFTLRIISHFSCFNAASNILQDTLYVLKSLPKDLPDGINAWALYLQTCAKVVTHHGSLTDSKKKQQADIVVCVLDSISDCLKDDHYYVLQSSSSSSETNIRNSIAYCCDSVINYVMVLNKEVVSTCSVSVDTVIKISIRQQLKGGLDLSRTIESIGRVLSLFGKQVGAELKVISFLQGILESLSDIVSIQTNQLEQTISLVFNIYCRLLDPVDPQMMNIIIIMNTIISVIRKSNLYNINNNNYIVLEVMTNLLAGESQLDVAVHSLINKNLNRCHFESFTTDAIRDRYVTHLLVDMRLCTSVRAADTTTTDDDDDDGVCIKSFSSSTESCQEALLLALLKNKNTAALVKLFRLQLCMMTQFHRYIQRANSVSTLCSKRHAVVQFVSRLLVFVKNIHCAELHPLISPFINGIGAVLTLVFPLLPFSVCVDQLDREILCHLYRNLGDFVTSLLSDLKTNVKFLAESSSSIVKLCLVCTSSKFQAVAKESMQSLEFFFFVESVMSLVLSDSAVTCLDADGPMARLSQVYCQEYFSHLLQLDSNLLSESTFAAVSKEFWVFAVDRRIGGALLTYLWNGFYTEVRNQLLIINPAIDIESRIKNVVALFNMCVLHAFCHKPKLVKSFQADLRHFITRLLSFMSKPIDPLPILVDPLPTQMQESQTCCIVDLILFVRHRIVAAELIQLGYSSSVEFTSLSSSSSSSSSSNELQSILKDSVQRLSQLSHCLTTNLCVDEAITMYLLRSFPSDVRRLFQLLHLHGLSTCMVEIVSLSKNIHEVLSSNRFQHIQKFMFWGQSEITLLWESLTMELHCLLSIQNFIQNDFLVNDSLPLAQTVVPSDLPWSNKVDCFSRICHGLFLLNSKESSSSSASLFDNDEYVKLFESLLQSCLSSVRAHCITLPKEYAKETAEPLCAWLHLIAARVHICVFGNYKQSQNHVHLSLDCAGLSTQFYLRIIQAECSLTSMDLCDVRGDPEAASTKVAEALAYAASVSSSLVDMCKLQVCRIYYRLQSNKFHETLTSIIISHNDQNKDGSENNICCCTVNAAKLLYATFVENKVFPGLVVGADKTSLPTSTEMEKSNLTVDVSTFYVLRFRHTDRYWNISNMDTSTVRAPFPISVDACKLALLLSARQTQNDSSVTSDACSLQTKFDEKTFDSFVMEAAKLDLNIPFDFNNEIRSRLSLAAMQFTTDSFAQFWMGCSSVGAPLEYLMASDKISAGLVSMFHNNSRADLQARLKQLQRRSVGTILFFKVDSIENRVLVGRYDTDESHVEVVVACKASTFLHWHDVWIQLVEECNEQLHCTNPSNGKDIQGAHAAKKEWWSRRSAIDAKFKTMLDDLEVLLGQALNLFAGKSTTVESLDLLASNLSLQGKEIEIVNKPTLDYAAMKVSELKQLLVEKGITFNGKALKADLVSLLSQSDCTPDIEVCRRSSATAPSSSRPPLACSNISKNEVPVGCHHGEREPIEIGSSGSTVLVLDGYFQFIPLESLPSLKTRSCCRVPSLGLLLSYPSVSKVLPLEWSTWYTVDPDGNLPETADIIGNKFLRPISHRKKNWTGFVSEAPSSSEFSRLHAESDLFIYCGHGGGEQLYSSRKLRRLTKCPSTVWLWGCSSGGLKKSGVYQPWGIAINYLLAGSTQVAGALWDVTDKDLDKLSISTMQGLRGFENEEEEIGNSSSAISIADSIINGRMECKMKYAVGAACIIYGLP